MAEGQKETGTEGQGKCWQWRGKKVGDGARRTYALRTEQV